MYNAQFWTRLFALFIVHCSLFIAPPALAQFGLLETAREAGLLPSQENIGPASLIGTIVGYLLAFVGVIFFVLMVYGGILWMTARGNDEQVKKAQELIKSAVMGIVIVFVSYVVTSFVLTRLLSAARI